MMNEELKNFSTLPHTEGMGGPPMPQTANTVILQDHIHGSCDWIKFTDPHYVITAHNSEEVQNCLQKISEVLKNGYYAAGYFCYEAATGVDSSLLTKKSCGYPLLWFGIYKDYQKIDLNETLENKYSFTDWIPDISETDYTKNIDKIKNYIGNGDTYQVNYTFRLQSDFCGDPLSLFTDLSKSQKSEYCAFVDTDDITICSFSPELFFKYEHGIVTSKPMKGTVKRGCNIYQDDKQAVWLKNSLKNRAENIMITDMIRNDLGRFAQTGSVHVESLFDIERFPTVFQMTSTVTARADIGSVDIVKNMFPCASITGAPKKRTMEIIDELETSPRGIYTGSIGYFSPENKAQFNVAIRTVVIDKETKSAQYGVGSGIVWDSIAQEEYDECILKSAILGSKENPCELLETILWDSCNGFWFLDKHILRMAASAQYFGISLNQTDLMSALDFAVLEITTRSRVRVILRQDGDISVSVNSIESMIGKKVGIAGCNIESKSKYIFNKTTNRKVYDKAKLTNPEMDDVILINNEGMVTESCIANVVIRKNGTLFTPDIECGLLNGVFRSLLLEKHIIEEAKITVQELILADDVYLINSVRGWMKLQKDTAESIWTIISESFGTDFKPELF